MRQAFRLEVLAGLGFAKHAAICYCLRIMPHVTRTDQLPSATLTASQSKTIRAASAAMEDIATCRVIMNLLAKHSDPLVRAAAQELRCTGVQPWIDATEATHSPFLAATAPDHYDLVLDGEEEMTIGRRNTCAVQITGTTGTDGVDSLHVVIKRDADGTWAASLTGLATIMAVNSVTHSRLLRDCDEPEQIPVAPGDTITIGHNIIHLHATTEGEREA